METDYAPPQHVIDEWKKHCQCCQNCSPHPCDGVAAGDMCDSVECDCFGDDDDEQPYGFEPECYMDADGYCSMQGTEHCDWDCPEGGC